MKMFVSIMFILCSVWLSSECWAGQYEFWNEVISKIDNGKIKEAPLKIIEYDFPKIDSINKERSKDPSLKNFKMASSLFRAIVNFENKQMFKEQQDLSIVKGVYQSLATAVRKENGFVNIALMNTINKAIFNRLSYTLFMHPDSIVEIRLVSNEIIGRNYSYHDFITLFRIEKGIRLDETVINTERAFYEYVDKSPKKNCDQRFADFESRKTSSILSDANIYDLYISYFYLKDKFERTLHGALRFFEKGGDINKVSPKDVTYYNQIMGKERFEIKNDILRTGAYYDILDLKYYIENYDEFKSVDINFQ